MFKWVAGLCAAMYLVLMTAGEPSPKELAAREATSEQQVTRSTTMAVDTTPIKVAATPVDQEQAPEPVVLASVSEIESPVLVSASTENVTPAVPEPVATEEIAALTPDVSAPAIADIRRVTGRRVNLREGPSTTTDIVGRAVRDDSAEVIEVLPSGWAKVYILETGVEAYISTQFLSDAG